MNTAILMGYLTADPVTRATSTGTVVSEYCIAVKRKYKEDGEYQTDFIECTAWNKAGEFAQKYFRKGSKVIVKGPIRTGSYKNKKGDTVKTFNIVIEDQEFAESKKSSEENPIEVKQESFMNIPDTLSDDLPFI